MKKALALFLAVTILFVFASCGGEKEIATDVLPVCLASEPNNIDPALNSTADGATIISHLFSGLTKWSKDENGKLIIVPECAEELSDGILNENGTVTYTYKLKKDLMWSDGKPLKASDFVFAWNRAASPLLGSGYNYLFEAIEGYKEMNELIETGEFTDDGKPVYEQADAEASLSVEAPDDNTLVVTLMHPINYWNELLAFPTFYPVREDVVADEKWATDPITYISNGAYRMTGWEHNSLITIEKNENYYDAETVTMPTIKFYLSDNANNMLTNFKNNDWLLIDDVPTNEMTSLKNEYPDEYFVEGQLGTYYICWNINEELLPESSELKGVEAERARQEIRKAFGLLIDRNYIVNEVSKGGEVPASSFVSMGLTDADGSQFYKSAGSDKNNFDGYYDVSTEAVSENYQAAMNTLKKYYNFDEASQKFTNIPTLYYIYNTAESHRAIAEYIQNAFASVGINMELTNQEWNTFVDTRKNGDYTVARNAWVADYNDPVCYLDMWISTSGNNDIQFGKGNHRYLKLYDLNLEPYGINYKVKNGTWSETYDILVDEIKACTDTETRYKLMHLAEDMLMETGCITPIYYNTDTYMLDKRVEGFFTNPLGYKYFMYTSINNEVS
ncbi:MAG: peptide ABC transporter substrate-binding protein [Clostridia bacterium]|nr:peptide ABC transporter substrate-binding protein [Clostridia bacterium]